MAPVAGEVGVLVEGQETGPRPTHDKGGDGGALTVTRLRTTFPRAEPLLRFRSLRLLRCTRWASSLMRIAPQLGG